MKLLEKIDLLILEAIYHFDTEEFNEISAEEEHLGIYIDEINKRVGNQPFVYKLFEDSARIKRIADSSEGTLLVFEDVIISTARFYEFIAAELRDKFENTTTILDVNTFSEICKSSFANTYPHITNIFEYVEPDDFVEHISEVVKKLLNPKSKSYEYRIEKDGQIESRQSLYFPAELRTIKIYRTSKVFTPIDRAIKKIFLRLQIKTLTLQRVIREVNRMPVEIKNFPKPLLETNRNLLDTIKALPAFSYSQKEGTLALQDNKYQDIYKNLTDVPKDAVSDFHAQYSSEKNAGVFALYFTGDKFIIPNAVQYVNVRPIIYYDVSEDLDNYANNFFNPTAESWKEAHNILYAFLYNDETAQIDKYKLIQDWLQKNTVPRLHFCDKQEASELKEELLWAYPTPLNYTDNPDNPAKFSIENQLLLIHGK
ncbi:MAG: hypothetical protein HUU54_11070 [Ignavibacteriaceae bacterium]|nr:hypothetical protein [Ignavibacteriaceae bacterium]